MSMFECISTATSPFSFFPPYRQSRDQHNRVTHQ